MCLRPPQNEADKGNVLLVALSGGLCRPIACGLLIAGGGPHDGAYDDQPGKDSGQDDTCIPGALVDITISRSRCHRRQRIDIRWTLWAWGVWVRVGHAKPPSSVGKRAVPRGCSAAERGFS